MSFLILWKDSSSLFVRLALYLQADFNCKWNSSASEESKRFVRRSLICFLMSQIFTLCEHANTKNDCANGKYLIAGELLRLSPWLFYVSLLVWSGRLLKRAAGMRAERKANNAFRATKILYTSHSGSSCSSGIIPLEEEAQRDKGF